jgi:hypothetical protein
MELSLSFICFPENPASIKILLWPVFKKAELPLLLDPNILKSDSTMFECCLDLLLDQSNFQTLFIFLIIGISCYLK